MASKRTFKHLLIHLGIILSCFLLLSYLFFYIYLPHLTKHGESIEVPNLNGSTLEETRQKVSSKNLRYEIFDSVFNADYKPHTVISQFPKAGEKVKENRNIYITVTSLDPPVIKMPSLVDNSFKAAEMKLKSYGLVLGQVRYMPHANEGVVLRQMQGNQPIEPGKSIKKGSVIDLLVSSGVGNTDVVVPDLTGLSLSDAKNTLNDLGLSTGSIVYDDNSDKNEGTVIRQKPSNISGEATITLKVGEFVDVWVAGLKP